MKFEAIVVGRKESNKEMAPRKWKRLVLSIKEMRGKDSSGDTGGDFGCFRGRVGQSRPRQDNGGEEQSWCRGVAGSQCSSDERRVGVDKSGYWTDQAGE